MTEGWAFLCLMWTSRVRFARFRIRNNWKRVVDGVHSGLMFGWNVANDSVDCDDWKCGLDTEYQSLILVWITN